MASKLNKTKIVNAAQKYVQKGQYDRAIREYTKIVEDDPRDVRIWLKIGDLSAKKGSTLEAVDTYLKVAEFYSEQGFYLKAVAVYKQILKIDSSQVDVNLRLAELYRQLGLVNDAMQQYEMVANECQQRGRGKDALAALQQMVELAPDNVAGRIKLAELCSKEQMRAEAVEEFTKAADFLRSHNRLDDFIKVAERLIYHQPDNIAVIKELAGLYLRRRDPRRALQKLQLSFKADPRDQETLEGLAQAFADLGQVPKTISVLRELAHIQREMGLDRRWMTTYERILELAPDDAEANQALQGRSMSFDAGEMTETEVEYVAQPVAAQAEAVAPPSEAPIALEVPLEPAPSQPAPGSAGGASEDVERILAEADVYIKYGLYDKALDHLRQIFELDENNVEVRLKLSDVYQKQGRAGDAAAELVEASKRMSHDDPAVAVQRLREAAALDPANEEVGSLLASLVPQGAAGAPTGAESFVEEDITIQIGHGGDDAAPITLASEDIVEEIPIEASDLISVEPDAYAPALSDSGVAEAGTGALEGGDDVPLVVDYSADGSGSIEVYGEMTDTLGGGTPSSEFISLPVSPQRSPAQERVRQEEESETTLADDIEEVDFFIQQGLFDEAKGILEELSKRLPGHPLVEAKALELRSMAEAQQESSSAMLEGSTASLAADLAAELAQEAPEDGVSAEYSVEEIFQDLKQGVEVSEVAEEDADTHYDLGIAYREMGLLDDAIGEFKIAMRSREKEVLCRMMIGLCLLDQDQLTEAVGQLKSGLAVEGISEQETVALHFELGVAYERLGEEREALSCFDKASHRDPGFRDVGERIARLRRSVGEGDTGESGGAASSGSEQADFGAGS